MNDITALARRMKAEDISPERMEWLKKLANMEYCASNPGHWLMNLKETNYLASLALQCLENNLALVEALEKAQQQNGNLREQSAEWERKAISNFENCSEMAVRIEELNSSNAAMTAKIEPMDRRIDELEKALAKAERERDAFEAVAMALRDDMRESRTVTVKLPSLKQTESGERYVWSDGVHNFKADVIEILRAAGINVEAE